MSITHPSRTSEAASHAIGNIYLMVILVAERTREIKKTSMVFPYSQAILECEQGRLDIPHLVKRIQARK